MLRTTLTTQVEKVIRKTSKKITMESDESTEIVKWEANIQPPTIDELRTYTKNAFSCKYIKYMYSKFKNECPTGRMRVAKFKKMFGSYFPLHLDEEYILRLFTAFANGKEEMTFKDLMESLALLYLSTPEANAIWTIRMIKGSDVEAITEDDLIDFVKSVFRLAMLGKSKHGNKVSDCNFHMIDTALQNIAIHRSHGTFKALDKDGNGYICKSDFVNFFQQNGCLDPVFMKSFIRLKTR
uniref:EF-hand domain-containing protein n=1 Tax=Brugia malayi TaxID=6279 RepID=A0A5S6PIP6_BRUMA